MKNNNKEYKLIKKFDGYYTKLGNGHIRLGNDIIIAQQIVDGLNNDKRIGEL